MIDFPEPRTLENDEWPPDWVGVLNWRRQVVDSMRAEPGYRDDWPAQRLYYRDRPREWVNHWCMTYDPRLAATDGRLTTMPFIMFRRQDDFILALHEAVKAGADLLCEKSRTLGVTWLCCAFSVWLWLYVDGSAVGWGSRKQELVDKLGDASSIFEKIRIILRFLPPEMLPRGFSATEHASLMKIVNPETGSTITGEVGDNIGRGGRSLIYFKDESAHYEHPDMIEASLGYNTNVQIDVSSVNGPATVFQRKREAGEIWFPGRPMVKGRTNVFVFDWSEHPELTVEWYEAERKSKQDEGLGHVFAQEVDRNPSAAVVGTIIPLEWVRAAIGAAARLGIEETGGWKAALDVADGELGGDANALALRHGIYLKSVEAWNAPDVGETTRLAVGKIEEHAPIEVEYDCVGVGAGVKSEANRLREAKLLPRGVSFSPWNAGAAVLQPDRRVVPGDIRSALNKDFYGNLKAQAWWQLRLRFERTWRAVNEENYTYDRDELISIPPSLPQLQQLIKELTQVVSKKNSALKLIVDKKPDGTRSPNMADAVVMAFWPVSAGRPIVMSREAVSRSAHPFGRRSVFTSVRLPGQGASTNSY